MTDILAMSDEDFLKNLPSLETEAASSQEDPTQAATGQEQQEDPAALQSEEGTEHGQSAEVSGDEGSGASADRGGASGSELPEGEAEGTEGGASGATTDPSGEAKSDPVTGTEETGEADPAAKAGEAAADPSGSPKGAEGTAANKSVDGGETPINYEEAYREIMKPFKANGREITLKDPSEAIKLMQMGANYTRKMQELAPQRKLLTMLGNNSLLDESKLSFLIDLDKGDPEAIKKFIKDKGIDPLDIDTLSEPNYREGSHRVDDAEMNFRAQVEELRSQPSGMETITDINENWDQASKDILWDHPEIMTIIHGQRENGIYAKIVAEVDRQKTLGTIPAETPFLQAYKTAGDALTASGALADPVKSDTPAQTPAQKDPAPVVVGTSTGTPKSKVDADDKAGAASPSRSNPGKAREVVNFLAMDDETFLQQMNGRV